MSLRNIALHQEALCIDIALTPRTSEQFSESQLALLKAGMIQELKRFEMHPSGFQNAQVASELWEVSPLISKMEEHQLQPTSQSSDALLHNSPREPATVA